jgi:hypothetical protein
MKIPFGFFTLIASLLACLPAQSAAIKNDETFVFSRKSPLERQTPIPVSLRSTTMRDVERTQAAWRQRVMVKPFKAGLKGEPWSLQAAAFVQKTSDAWDSKDGVVQKDLIEEGISAIAAGCTDSVVIWLWARLQTKNAGTSPVLLNSLMDAVERFPQFNYPKAVGLMMAVDCKAAINKCGAPETVKSRAEELVRRSIPECALAALEDGSYGPGEDDLLVRDFVRFNVDQAATEQLMTSLSSPTRAEWARETLLGYCEKTLGWKDRGNDWADKVTEAGWKGFAEHLAKARVHLMNAWKLRPDQPEAAAGMIPIVMAGHGFEGDTLRTWFDRAVKAQFDYADAYHAMSWALHPRWGGSYEEMLAFARACLATNRFDTDTPIFYADTIESIATDLGDWRPVFRNPQIGSDLMRLAKALINEPTRADEQLLRRQLFAVYAFLSDRYEDVANVARPPLGAIFAQTRKKMNKYGIDKGTFESALAIMSGPGRDEFAKGEKRYRDYDLNGAETLYKAAALKMKGSASAAAGSKDPAALIARRLAAIRFERALSAANGGWVNFQPKANEWQVMDGDWRVNSDGSLANDGAGKAGLILAPGRPGENYELRGEFEVVSPASSDRDFSIVVGYSEASHLATAARIWQEGTGKMRAGIMNMWNLTGNSAQKEHTHEGKTQFSVQVWNGKVSLYLDGEPIQTDFQIDEDRALARDSLFGFGNQVFSKGNTTFVRNLSARRLTAKPEAPRLSK